MAYLLDANVFIEAKRRHYGFDFCPAFWDWLDTQHAAGTVFSIEKELNPELEARYGANRLGLTRQLRFSPRSEKSLDVTLSLNGIPIVTVELKNPLTGQTVDDALRQYRRDRDPREPIFEFKRRTLVHFAADTEAVRMTTRLAGTATHFLPFDKGCDGGAGNPPDPPAAPTGRPTSGRKRSPATVCSTSWRASFICRSTRSATTKAAR